MRDDLAAAPASCNRDRTPQFYDYSRISMTSSLKLLRRLLPSAWRHWLNASLLQFLRGKQIATFAKKFDVVVCNGHIPLTANNAEAAVRKGKDTIQIVPVLEANHDFTKPSGCLDGQFLPALAPIKVESETVLLNIKDRRFSLRNNHLLNPEMKVIDEHSLQFNKMPIRKQFLAKLVDLKGTVAYLSNTDPSNYYHWMCRTLPLLRIYDRFYGLDAIDFFYIGQSPLFSFHRESLIRAGVPLEKVLQKACTADSIVAAITNRSRHHGSAPIIEANYLFSRNLFRDVLETGGKHRIYVSRGNVKRRRLINESEVISVLENYGFTAISMDGKTLQEQVKIFSSSEAIVAPHGAALTNLLFIQPKTKIIELIPHGFVNSCFYVLTNYGQSDYFYLGGEETVQSHSDPHHFDILIDTQKLKQLCEQVFSR